uniref:Uncharacterized protein n=1 Tax=Rhizophora mucronata TaxID=61149 RepID=A0A2P2IT31_RHIMU
MRQRVGQLPAILKYILKYEIPIR